MRTITYGVRELQAKLAGAIRAASAGDRVVITCRGRPVAVLSGVNGRILRESSAERTLRRLAAEGKLRPGRPGRIPPFKPFPGGGVSAQVLADRR